MRTSAKKRNTLRNDFGTQEQRLSNIQRKFATRSTRSGKSSVPTTSSDRKTGFRHLKKGGINLNPTKKLVYSLFSVLIAVGFLFTGCTKTQPKGTPPNSTAVATDVKTLVYAGKPYVAINGNKPFFSRELLQLTEAEQYSPLDSLGRCGPAFAVVTPKTMPKEKRGPIGMIKPSGWHTVRYDDLIKDKYLYNRCHLIGFQLAGENANVKNLITGTRYLNVDGMLPFENKVSDYVKRTRNPVLYRVTPVFEDKELVARGVIMEGYSLKDEGKTICFNVFVFNVQPGIEIDYATGKSKRI